MENAYSNLQLDALREVSNIGVGNAATALSTLLGTKIDMSVPSVNMVELNELLTKSGEDVVVGIIVRVVGDIPGNILILFEEDMAENVIDYLVGSNAGIDSEMGNSVLCEVGNILSGSYMNAIAQFTKLFVNASVPAVAYDMMSAILATTFMESGQFDEYILDIETIFIKDRLAGKTKDATMYFFEKTTYLKEKELHNRKNYFNLAKNIAKETIS